MVWTAIGHAGIVDSVFFQGNVDSKLYLKIIEEELYPEFCRWIGRGGVNDTNIPWPPRSPDLTPMDFILWGYIKKLAYSELSGSGPAQGRHCYSVSAYKISDFKESIETKFVKITSLGAKLLTFVIHQLF